MLNSQAKRTTIYLDPHLHKTLKLKATETSKTISELIALAVQNSLAEDEEDLRAFKERANEPRYSYESVLKELKKNGKI
ncbi:CopG family transcriptional regulator [bacterium]|nr:CopG family transcriptional regulator [bacterium]